MDHGLLADMDVAIVDDDRLIISGWVFHTDHPIDSIAVWAGQTRLVSGLALEARTDVQEEFGGNPFALMSGFAAETACPPELADVTRFAFEIEASCAGRETERTHVEFGAAPPLSRSGARRAIKLIRTAIDDFMLRGGTDARTGRPSYVRGSIERVRIERGEITVRGWVFHSTRPITAISVSLGATPLAAKLRPADRPDVQALNEFIPFALRSGFELRAPWPHGQGTSPRYVFDVRVRPLGAKEVDARLAYYDSHHPANHCPIPPLYLRQRVGHLDPFATLGFKLYNDLKTSIERYRPIGAFERVLDWGCGCSRVLRHLVDDVPAERVWGCDIDHEAIAWDKEAIPGANFDTTSAMPPLPYPDGHFDLVYGLSIFTHINEETQLRWLAELRRVSKPGGLLLMSVHGPFMWPSPLYRAILKNGGFLDVESPQSEEFAQFAGDRYYRSSYHSEAYIRARWSEHFDILEFRDQAIHDSQALVIMRPR